MRELYAETGQVPFFFHHPVKETTYFYEFGKTRLCFQTKHGIEEAGVTNMGMLLKKLKPKVAAKYCLDNAPVKVRGKFIEPSKIQLDSPWYTISLSISLYTDIWLPFVHGNNYLYPTKLIAGKFISNEALANSHTPRFNNWLQAIKGITEDLGAKWQFDGISNYKNYEPMLRENGINLKYKPE